MYSDCGYDFLCLVVIDLILLLIFFKLLIICFKVFLLVYCWFDFSWKLNFFIVNDNVKYCCGLNWLIFCCCVFINWIVGVWICFRDSCVLYFVVSVCVVLILII